MMMAASLKRYLSSVGDMSKRLTGISSTLLRIKEDLSVKGALNTLIHFAGARALLLFTGLSQAGL
jgi:hypothetical protein